MSRRIEARADMHALDLTRDPETYVRMQRSLGARNLDELSPGALEYALWNTHPTGPQRIAMGREWARLHRVPVPEPLAERHFAVTAPTGRGHGERVVLGPVRRLLDDRVRGGDAATAERRADRQ